MKRNHIKLILTGSFTAAVFAFLAFGSNTAVLVQAGENGISGVSSETRVAKASRVDDETAAYYKKTCQMCHAANASKAFDPAKEEAVLVEAILKGRKGEKPPYMPEYGSKGVTEEKAKALVAHMKELKAAAN